LMRRGPAASRTRRGNVYEIGVIGGTALSAWLGGRAASRLGWRSGFGLAALALAIAWGLAALWLAPALLELGRQAPSRGGSTPARARLPWGAGLAIFLATFTLAAVWAGGIGTFLPLYGGRALALSPDVLGRMLSIAFAIEAAMLVRWAGRRTRSAACASSWPASWRCSPGRSSCRGAGAFPGLAQAPRSWSSVWRRGWCRPSS
jgi:MFS family permease